MGCDIRIEQACEFPNMNKYAAGPGAMLMTQEGGRLGAVAPATQCGFRLLRRAGRCGNPSALHVIIIDYYRVGHFLTRHGLKSSHALQ